jgi:hypothetical protein
LERSRRRKHSDWKHDDRHLKEWAPHLANIISLPGFETNIDDQIWAVGGFVKYRSTLDPKSPNSKPEDEILHLEKVFREKTNLTEARYLHLLGMPTGDPVESLKKIRSALQATRAKPGPLLPGEEIYPREGFLGQYLNYTQETAAPLAYHFWFGVSLLGAACRRNVYMELGYTLYPNQYLFIIGDTAEGKGIAFGKATPLVWKANDVVQREMERKDPDLGPLEGGAYPMRKVVVLPDKPTPQWLVSALVPQDGEARGSLAIFKGLDSVGWLANEEVSAWLGKRGDVYEGCVHIITAFYNCEEDWSAGTHTRGAENLKYMCLTVICGSNMEWINKSVTPDMFEGGFIRRCLFISRSGAPKREYLDEPPPLMDPLQADIMAGQMAAWMQAEAPCEIKLGEGAKRLYSSFNRELERKKLNPEEPRLHYYYLGKYNFVMKLAMVLSVNRHTWHGITVQEIAETLPSIQMKAEDLELAIELVEHEERYLPECFARIGEHSHATQYRKIAGILNSHHTKTGKRMKRADLGKACISRGMGSEWSTRVNEMIEIGMVKGVKISSTGGRPATELWDPDVIDLTPKEESNE